MGSQPQGGTMRSRALLLVNLMLVAISCLVAQPAQAQSKGGKSAATIIGQFGDSCRDFAAHSSKDISYVELHYVAGPVVKDESINRPDHVIDGGAGSEIDFVSVKSGTTIEEFECVRSSHPPTAWLEMQTPPLDLDPGAEHCTDFITGPSGGSSVSGSVVQQTFPRTVWTNASQIPLNTDNLRLLLWGCGALTETCPFTFNFRGIGSSDPDGDITSWSIDFGDGTSAGGNWITAPPTEVAHEYPTGSCGGSNFCLITLTVTDSAGQSSSDTMLMAFLDQQPG